MNEEQDGIEDTLDSSVVAEPETAEVDETVPKSEYEKAMELANNYKIRAEKAEKKAKEKSDTSDVSTSQPKSEAVSLTDQYALLNAKVPVEDVQDVIDYATFKGISVAEALQSSVVKNTLAEKAEYRVTAAAANTGSSKRGSGRTSDEALLANAAKGIIPESDEDINRLIALKAK